MIIVRGLDEQVGLREMRAKICAKAGIAEPVKYCRLSLLGELCYGSRAMEIVRNFLDSGGLEMLLRTPLLTTNKCWTGADAYRYYLVLACVMSLGPLLFYSMVVTMSSLTANAYDQAARYPRR